ncbi:MAG: phage coat protein, partial [Oscillospiraceae bacterium]|nr:phage coat protein [Oscillospiraceae bacterium]
VIKNGADTLYTTYILGEGAFSYEDISVKNAYELARDPKTNGGEDTLYMRQRKVFAPYGISYEKQIQASVSPTDEELADGENWTLANMDFDVYVDHKKIPIARIISKG